MAVIPRADDFPYLPVVSRGDDPPYLPAFAAARVRSQKARSYRVRFAATDEQGGPTWLR